MITIQAFEFLTGLLIKQESHIINLFQQTNIDEVIDRELNSGFLNASNYKLLAFVQEPLPSFKQINQDVFTYRNVPIILSNTNMLVDVPETAIINLSKSNFAELLMQSAYEDANNTIKGLV